MVLANFNNQNGLKQIGNATYVETAVSGSAQVGEAGSEGSATSNISISNLSITIEDTTRSIIVRGYKKDLDIVAAVVKEIDVRTKQVLIEAFIVEADSNFEKK